MKEYNSFLCYTPERFSGNHSFLVNTLLLYIPLLTLTDRITDRGTNTLTSRGLEELFSSCAVVSVSVLVGNRFWFYILLMYLGYNTVVVLCYFFWFWREIVFGVTYVLSVQYSCAAVSFFVVVVRKIILYEYLTVTIVSQKYQELSL